MAKKESPAKPKLSEEAAKLKSELPDKALDKIALDKVVGGYKRCSFACGG